MAREMRARLHLSDELEAFLEESASSHHRDVNGEIVSILSERMQLAEEQKVSKPRPCVIAVGLRPFDSEEIKRGLEHLHTIFSYADGNPVSNGFEVICAGPKNGLTYDEAFIICQKRYFEVGWVYADVVLSS